MAVHPFRSISTLPMMAFLTMSATGSHVHAGQTGSFTSGAFSAKGPAVRDPRTTKEQYPAYGQILKSYSDNTKSEAKSLYELKIYISQQKPRREVTISIFDTLPNLTSPRTYMLYNSDRRNPPYASLVLHGSVDGDSCGCEPKAMDATPIGRLTIDSIGGVGAPITGRLDIVEGWQVPRNCQRLGVVNKAAFSVVRAIDYLFDCLEQPPHGRRVPSGPNPWSGIRMRSQQKETA